MSMSIRIPYLCCVRDSEVEGNPKCGVHNPNSCSLGPTAKAQLSQSISLLHIYIISSNFLAPSWVLFSGIIYDKC